MSKLVLNCGLEKNNNKTQCLTKFLICQFLRAHQMKYLQTICATIIFFVSFEDTNSQHKHIFLRINKQQHPKPLK